MENYDIRGIALLGSYYQKQKQYVHVGTMRRISTETQMGVHQCSISGPLLFVKHK